jgi:ABC-type proline/glycine betaine transport system ATPase subunit
MQIIFIVAGMNLKINIHKGTLVVIFGLSGKNLPLAGKMWFIPEKL